MKKVIILSYLIGLIGFQSFTRENTTINFFESESRNAQKALFRPLEVLSPITAQSVSGKDFNSHETNPLSDTLGVIMAEGEINQIGRLSRYESQPGGSTLGYLHFASEKVLEK